MKMLKGKRGRMRELLTDSERCATAKPRAQRSGATDPPRRGFSTWTQTSGAPLRCALGLGAFLSLLMTGCYEPPDRIQVHSTGEGRVEITRVPKEPVEPPASPVVASPVVASPVVASPTIAPAQPVQPPPAIATVPPPEVAVPATVPSAAVPTDEAAKQRRIDDLQKKVQEMNAEIDRLKTQPTTAP